MATMADDTALSVDEIFSKYSVAEAKEIADGYSKKIDQASAELYDLVGSKYRDLIKIAEDINQLYGQGRDIDNALSSLVYRQQTFVPFGDSPRSKFNSRQRAALASQARADNQGNILRNLINNRLLKVDLLLTGGLKIRHTSQFIHHAKVFYTIGQKFHDLLESDPSLDSWFRKLKQSYRKYLEDRIRSYNVLSPHQIASDAVHSSQVFDKSHLTGDHSYYDDDTTGSDDDDVSSLKETAVLYPNIDVVTSHSAAIVNYLVAYTILLAPDGDIDIGKALVELRLNYWQEVVDKFADVDSVSFVHAIKYVEATFEYADLVSNTSSDYHKVLNLTTRPWKSRDFIGYKNWLENEDVTYSGDNVLFSNASDQLDQLIKTMFDWVAKLIDRQTPHSALAIAHNANIFARFALDYFGIKDFYANFDTTLLLSTHIDKSTQFSDLLVAVTEVILHHFERYFQQGHKAALEAVAKKTLSLHIPSPFSADTMKLMDSDIDQYLKVVSAITSGGSSPVADAVGKWITEYKSFCTVMRFADEDSIISQLLKVTKANDIDGFTSGVIQKKLEAVQDKSHKLFNKYLADIVDNIDRDSSPVKHDQTDEVYFYLDALKVIKEKTHGISDITDTLSRVDTLLNRLYDLVIEKIDSTFVVNYTDSGEEDVPLTPSIELRSAISQITQKLLSGGSTERKFGKLFLDESVHDLFKSKKNQWLAKAFEKFQNQTVSPNGTTNDNTDSGTEKSTNGVTTQAKETDLSDDKAADKANKAAAEDATEDITDGKKEDVTDDNTEAIADKAAEDVVDKSSNGSNTKFDPARASQRKFADLVYLNLLMGKSGTDITTDIDDTTRNVIIGGVTQYHTSSKCLWLPLSA
ncbi:hypothetical protein DIURU_002196 [Diutina rugosa]|uniref:Uncharacterized protein n=1 Tax=Diutina rugosa TaxID=5481 RepID=A0A642UVD5_DIURU|nr:uncharacterized protein DIURU_002196 [Diutina rugosa]KAA8903685.1 hypothetical protein DIURU_002196 [Diutina rugosa]